MTPSVRMTAREREVLPTAEDASASSAMMPPSPLLSARMMSSTYLSETTIINDQKMVDRPPRILAAFRGIPWPGAKVSLTAYSGLVPMSPYTTPRASRARAVVEDPLGDRSLLLFSKACSDGGDERARTIPPSRMGYKATRAGLGSVVYRSGDNKHGVAVTIETVTGGDRMAVGGKHRRGAGEGADQHQQGRAGKMKIGQQRVHRPEA